MNKKIIWLVATIVIVVIIIVALAGHKPGVGGQKTEDTIKVGIIAPLTGTASAYGIEGKNTVVLALDEINAAGGVAGKQVQYFIEDGKCDANAAIAAWNKLVSVNGVSIVFGGHCSGETLAIAPLSARDHVPVFAVFATAPKVANEGEWLFRHISTNEYYGAILAQQAYSKGWKAVAVITEVKDFPVTYSDAFENAFTALGGKIVLDERFDPGTKDYRTIVLKLKGLKYDALFISSQGPDVMGLITDQVEGLSLGKAYLYNHAFGPAKFLELTKGYMPKDYIIIAPYADPSSAKVQAFNDAYKVKYGSAYNFSTFFIAADYDIVHRYAEAGNACVALAGGYSVDCVRDQFKNATSYSGVAGDVTISSKYSPKSVLTPVGLIHVDAATKTLTMTPIN